MEGIRTALGQGASLEERDAQGACGLHRAARSGHATVVKMLLDMGMNANAIDKKMFTPLHEACSNGHVDCARVLLDAGAKTNMHKANCSLTNGGFTPLHSAAANGHAACIQMLLERGGDVFGGDRAGECPLHSAVRANSLEIVSLLLRSKQHPWAFIRSRNGRTPLHVAALHGRKECAELLLQNAQQCQAEGAILGLVMTADCGGCVPLHEAAAGGHIDLLQVLVENGTPIDVCDSGGKTALQVAGEERQEAAARWLIAHGAVKHAAHAQVEAALSGADEGQPQSFLQQAIMKVSPAARRIIEQCESKSVKSDQEGDEQGRLQEAGGKARRKERRKERRALERAGQQQGEGSGAAGPGDVDCAKS